MIDLDLNPNNIYVEVQRWFDGREGPRQMNVGCGPHYAGGWLNTDVHRGDGNEPDIVVRAGCALPVPDNYLDRLYMGHVAEHVPWDEVVPMFADAWRALKPGGELVVVGPDAKRTLDMWKANRCDWELVDAVWESDDAFMITGVPAWPGARHSWNCTEERIVKCLELAGFGTVEHRCIQNELVGDLRDWPIVAYSEWQLSVWARR